MIITTFHGRGPKTQGLIEIGILQPLGSSHPKTNRRATAEKIYRVLRSQAFTSVLLKPASKTGGWLMDEMKH